MSNSRATRQLVGIIFANFVILAILHLQVFFMRKLIIFKLNFTGSVGYNGESLESCESRRGQRWQNGNDMDLMRDSNLKNRSSLKMGLAEVVVEWVDTMGGRGESAVVRPHESIIGILQGDAWFWGADHHWWCGWKK
ncbi:hypothetical protein IW261DRAFT_1412901 [Armillaria novae-zelandiae]|uniref:Uncharacterized protein n=1 Tax=Armillaria novae-zelandiae TaxID=153914 RepID=A0AA39PVD7_9AGAR|nr:hypothetical protein IW261DRAFT_1412901 [Armillaria novae-zelandiae]